MSKTQQGERAHPSPLLPPLHFIPTEHIPVLAAAVSSPGNGTAGVAPPQQAQAQQQQQLQNDGGGGGGALLALLLGHSVEQGCLQATLLASQGPLFDAAKDANALRAANGVWVGVHRPLSIEIDLTHACMHTILYPPAAHVHNQPTNHTIVQRR